MFLESCRNLKEGRAYWERSSGFARWVARMILPVPVLGLQEDGHRLLDALTWLEEQCRRVKLTEETIRLYHRMISPSDSQPGSYRMGSAIIVGSSVPRPHFQKVAALMKQLDIKMIHEQDEIDGSNEAEEERVLRVAVGIHQRIAFIHPFRDANGRVARLAMNHVLRRYQKGYAILPPLNESPEHFDALEAGHRGDLEPLLRFTKKHFHRV